MSLARSGGVLLHPTSLPGPSGIGDIGPAAHTFIDWLADSGCRLWQILPLGPTGYGNSPYQCHSVFAGNPLLLSPELLLRDGLLDQVDLEPPPGLSMPFGHGIHRVDFSRVIPWKLRLLEHAFERYQALDSKRLGQEFRSFRQENSEWLEDFSLFMALKESNANRSWHHWPASIRRRKNDSLRQAQRALEQSITRLSFYQFLFFRQWNELRDHARQKGIRIIGDVPIFAADDSSDVWANPELFDLDADGFPTGMAGVPPDHFSLTGQLWGNPLYRWEEHRRSRYAWWLKRLQAILKLVDVARLDHFRGFDACWEIPVGRHTAEIGNWIAGPSTDFLDAVARELGDLDTNGVLPFIAEDLGVITPQVIDLRNRHNLPGMRVLQFGFSGSQDLFLPHNYVAHCVAYTGTHDNDTARGWLRSAPGHERTFALHYLNTTNGGFAWDMIRAIWSSVAIMAIAPMQDFLNLGTEARMNYPGTTTGNWEWRMRRSDLSSALAGKLRGLNELYAR